MCFPYYLRSVSRGLDLGALEEQAKEAARKYGAECPCDRTQSVEASAARYFAEMKKIIDDPSFRENPKAFVQRRLEVREEVECLSVPHDPVLWFFRNYFGVSAKDG